MANSWLTAPQAAKLLGVAPFSLHRMARRGELRFLRLGRLWLFERREIARLKRKRKHLARTRRKQDHLGVPSPGPADGCLSTSSPAGLR
jgi:excisionase family DNA binding protein